MKRFLAAAVCFCLLLCLLAGCAAPAQQPSPTEEPAQSEAPAAEASALFVPGTYEGTGTGFGGELKVSVTVDETRILSVTVVENKETVGVADPALEKIPAEIVKNQTLAVDAISGCTFASRAIVEAVTNALTPICSDMAALQKAVEQEAGSSETIELSADVAVIGAGGAGLAAATEAVEAGASVVVLEKMPAIGGNTIRAGSALNAADPERQKSIEMTDLERETIRGILAAEPHDAYMAQWQKTLAEEFSAYEAAGSTYLFDSPALHKLQTYMGGDYVGNPEIIDVFCDNALAGVEFLSKYGALWQDGVTAAMGATWKRSHNPQLIYGSKGATFIYPLRDFLEGKSEQCQIFVDYKAEHLLMENGVCVGVSGTTTDGQPFTVSASSVVIATGGFSANVEMREKYNKHWATLNENVGTSNHPGATGDGIAMALEAGANLVGMEWIQLTPWGSKSIPQAAIDNQIFVNKEGERFINEDNRRDVMAAEALKQTDSTFFLIYDGHTIVNGVSQTGNKMDERVGQDLDGEMIYKADTLEDLAAQIGVPYETLKKTVDEFNACVDGTATDALGRSLYDQRIDKAPFYASKTFPVVHHTMGGIEIDPSTEVLDESGKVIEGLYAAGETTGGVHGSNRLGGNAIADIFVFGRIAGQNAAAQALSLKDAA